jgi:cation transport ATPase
MGKVAASVKWAAIGAAVLASPAALVFAGPFAAGIAHDVIDATGAMPVLIALSCVVALIASLSVRSRAP